MSLSETDDITPKTPDEMGLPEEKQFPGYPAPPGYKHSCPNDWQSGWLSVIHYKQSFLVHLRWGLSRSKFKVFLPNKGLRCSQRDHQAPTAMCHAGRRASTSLCLPAAVPRQHSRVLEVNTLSCPKEMANSLWTAGQPLTSLAQNGK